MSAKVAAIGIDAPNGRLLDDWIRHGLLPNIRAVADRGVTCSYTHVKKFRNERCWDTFLSGREMAGCGSVFLPDRYDYFNESLQRESRYTPFYALGKGHRVCMFDLPATLSQDVNGIQVSGWGSELNSIMPTSMPATLLAELRSRHGSDPKLVNAMRVQDYGTGEYEQSYVLPSLYDLAGLIDFKEKLLSAVSRRTDIALDLLGRDDWDLFLTLYSESHTANHILWHLGEAHPLAPLGHAAGHAALEVFRAIDDGIGRILAMLPTERHALIYTIDDTAQNAMDVPSMVLLPELMYRWCFNGCQALALGDMGQPAPPLRTDYRLHWKHEVWSLRTAAGERLLASPTSQESSGDPLSWNPANWYKPLWPDMKAFALPSVADGYVRFNVKGREAEGRIDQSEFAATRAEVVEMLGHAINPRSGRPLVKRVLATREAPLEKPEVPPDLIVCWDDHVPADMVDCPEVGRIGPVPYFRTGGHLSHGSLIENFCVACGPSLPAGQPPRTGKLEDLSATILHLVGATVPDQVKGRPFF